MNSGKFVFFSQQEPFKHSLNQPHNQDFSWPGKEPINVEVNYWILLTIPCLLFIAFILELRKKYFTLKVKKSELPQSLDIPCYQCQYFNQNPYLKCAINPSLALTKDSYNCKDFQDQKN